MSKPEFADTIMYYMTFVFEFVIIALILIFLGSFWYTAIACFLYNVCMEYYNAFVSLGAYISFVLIMSIFYGTIVFPLLTAAKDNQLNLKNKNQE